MHGVVGIGCRTLEGCFRESFFGPGSIQNVKHALATFFTLDFGLRDEHVEIVLAAVKFCRF